MNRHMHISTFELPLELGVVKGPIRSQAFESNGVWGVKYE